MIISNSNDFSNIWLKYSNELKNKQFFQVTVKMLVMMSQKMEIILLKMVEMHVDVEIHVFVLVIDQTRIKEIR